MSAEVTRPAVHWLSYQGDCRAILNEGAKGPTVFGEPVWPVTADFDGTRTRVGFSYVAPPRIAAERFADYTQRRKATAAAYEYVASLVATYCEGQQS